MDDQDVTGCPTEDVLIDAPLDEALEEALPARADDDQVDVPLPGQAHDCLRGWANGRDEFRIELTLGDDATSLLEPLGGVTLCTFGLPGLDRRGDVRDDEPGPERSGEAGGALERLRGRIVISNEDGFQQEALSTSVVARLAGCKLRLRADDCSPGVLELLQRPCLDDTG